MDNHFKIIIPLYNVEKWIKICLRSVRVQDYKNFECIILDDLSTDNSVQMIKEEIAHDTRFKLVINQEKSYALKNIYDGIKISNPKPEDIIITLDGDDWLASKKVLSTLNEIYNKQDCWLTYGSYAEYPGNQRGKFAKKIPTKVIEDSSYRTHQWCSSHLRTFKHHLWNKIKKQDLLDNEGKFYRMTWDMAFMFPMLEMAGSKSHYVKDILYIYNLGNPLNDHKVDNSYQIQLEKEIRGKPKYKKLLKDSITCKILGPGDENSGLGNQLFCIAATVAYSMKNNKAYSFPDIDVYPQINKYKKSLYKNLNTKKISISCFYKEKDYSFSEIPSYNKNLEIQGYFQSFKYFQNYRNEIFELLNICQEKKLVVQKYGDYSDYTSIHVRRGDYLKLQDFYNVLGVEYYKKSMDSFEVGQKFLLFSDDLEWCKKNFIFSEMIEFISCDHDYEELLLMSTCKNNIIANSTFSWWAAWFNENKNKVVIYPKKWFGKKYENLSTRDLCPPHWRSL